MWHGDGSSQLKCLPSTFAMLEETATDRWREREIETECRRTIYKEPTTPSKMHSFRQASSPITYDHHTENVELIK